MSQLLLVAIVGIPLLWLVGMSAFAYYDAGRVGMNQRKWAAIALFVPLFGFLAYILERSELSYDPTTDPYAGGGYNLHEDDDEDS